jgi:hypothetical protein
VLIAVTAVLALLLAASARRRPAVPAPAGEEEDPDLHGAAPADVSCRELVILITDYLDGRLPAGWRTGLDRHLADCDGCTSYLQQIRATIDALARLDGGTAFVPPGPGHRS